MHKAIISIIAIIGITSITGTTHAGFFENRTGAVQDERDASGRNASATYYQRLHHTQEEIDDNILKAQKDCGSNHLIDPRTGQPIPLQGFAFQYRQMCLDKVGASVGMQLDMSGGGTVNNGGIQNGIIQGYRLISYSLHNQKGQQIIVSKNDRESFILKIGTESSSTNFASILLFKNGAGIINDLRIPVISAGRKTVIIQQQLNVNTLPKLAEKFYENVISKRGMAFHYYVSELLGNQEIRDEFMNYIVSLATSPVKPPTKNKLTKK